MCVVLKVCKQGALGQGVDTVKEGGEKNSTWKTALCLKCLDEDSLGAYFDFYTCVLTGFRSGFSHQLIWSWVPLLLCNPAFRRKTAWKSLQLKTEDHGGFFKIIFWGFFLCLYWQDSWKCDSKGGETEETTRSTTEGGCHWTDFI